MKTRTTSMLAAVYLCAGLGVFTIQGAAFMKLGDIKGEVTDSEHKDWIIIESMSQGIFEEKDASSGLPTGKRQHRPFTVTKEIDKASPKLMEHCVNGQAIPLVRVEFVRTGGQDRYYEIVMKNVLVSSYQFSGSAGQSVPVDSFSLNYEEIKWTYTQFNEKGIADADHSYRWSLLHEAGETDVLPPGSFRLAFGAGTSENSFQICWEGFEEFQYVIKGSPNPEGPYELVHTYTPTADGEQEQDLPVGMARMFFRIEKVPVP